MPTTLAPTDLANIALSKIGALPINSLTDLTSSSAIACNTNFQLAYLEVSRSARWNCLLNTANLTQVAQTPLPDTQAAISSIQATAWEPYTYYAANSYVTYGNYYYQVNFNYTSTNNFTNDVTANFLTQTDQNTWNQSFYTQGGSQYASGWPYQYELPSDFQLLAILNDNECWDFEGAGGDDYEIMGNFLYCNCQQAVVQYVTNQPDTTRFDSLMADAFTYKLAASIATQLRQDGGHMQATMFMAYQQQLRKARAKNGGEKQARRWNPIRSSRFNQARYGGVNG